MRKYIVSNTYLSEQEQTLVKRVIRGESEKGIMEVHENQK